MSIGNKLKTISLTCAEHIDAWRIFPRVFVGLYAYLMYALFTWFKSLETFTTTKCDNDVLTKLLESGIDIAQAQEIACTVINIVGGPTTQQTAFVTTICSLAAVIFSFYTNSGRDWSNSPKKSKPNPKPPHLDEEQDLFG